MVCGGVLNYNETQCLVLGFVVIHLEQDEVRHSAVTEENCGVQQQTTVPSLHRGNTQNVKWWLWSGRMTVACIRTAINLAEACHLPLWVEVR